MTTICPLRHMSELDLVFGLTGKILLQNTDLAERSLPVCCFTHYWQDFTSFYALLIKFYSIILLYRKDLFQYTDSFTY